MLKNKFYYLIIGILFLVIIPCPAQNQIKIDLKFYKDQYKFGEPIIGTLNVENISDKELNFGSIEISNGWRLINKEGREIEPNQLHIPSPHFLKPSEKLYSFYIHKDFLKMFGAIEGQAFGTYTPELPPGQYILWNIYQPDQQWTFIVEDFIKDEGFKLYNQYKKLLKKIPSSRNPKTLNIDQNLLQEFEQILEKLETEYKTKWFTCNGSR